MKVKEVSVTASIAWSPKDVGAPYLACGTAALHADPAAKADTLQVYALNLSEQNLNMKLMSSIPTATRFHKVVWGRGGTGQTPREGGVVACAGDNGGLYLYSGSHLMAGVNDSSALLTSMEGKHSGSVFSLDFNHHQHNMLASGSKDCEVFIWDINEPSTPMSPATKATLAADVTCVAWNRQVEKILASCYGGRCIVFDCHKSKSIFQISDAVSRVKASTVCWHPTIATQLALASYDDMTPVLQIWDLRFPSAPLRQCDGHQRGLQSLAWCVDDADMLLTAAKDNRVLCWNPNTGECICELPSYNQWSFEVNWCPRDPALVASATVDGSVSVYSMLGGGYVPPRDFKFSAIADSFPDMEMPVEVPAAAQPQPIYPLKTPAFMTRGNGCSFAFGGRLLSWSKDSKTVSISQVVTEPQLVDHSNQLLGALQQSTSLQDYCAQKLSVITAERDREVWQYINASFQGNSVAQYLTLLGHPPPMPSSSATLTPPEEDGANLCSQMAALNAADGASSGGSLDPSEQFEMIASASENKTPEPELLADGDMSSRETPQGESHKVSLCTTGAGGSIRKAIITGQFEDAVEQCLQDVSQYSLALIIAHHAGHDLFIKTRDRVLSLERDSAGVCGLLCAVVKTDLQSLVHECDLQQWREAIVAVITHCNGDGSTQQQLLQALATRLHTASNMQAALICSIIAGDLDSFAQCWTAVRAADGELSTPHLQELVEMILVLQQCAHSRSDGGHVGQYLAQYASILATQGALNTAYHYLSANTQLQDTLAALKDRLAHALNITGTAGGGGGRGRTVSTCSAHSRGAGGYRRTSTPSQQAAQFTPSVQARQATVNASQQAAPFSQSTPAGGGQFFQPQQQPYQQQQAPAMMMPPPPSAPPQMTPCFPTTGFQTPVSAAPPPVPPSASVAAPGGLRRPGSSRYINTTSSSLPQTSFPPNTFMPAPSDPTFSPTTAGGGLETLPHKPPAAFDSSVPRGWNDPPPMSAVRRESSIHHQPMLSGNMEHSGAMRLLNIKAKQQQQQQQKNVSPAPEAVTAMVPSAPLPSAPQPQYQNFQSGYQPMAPPPTSFAPVTNSSAVSSTPAPPPAAPPAPLPAEAQGVHDTLSGLLQRTLMSVQSSPTTHQTILQVSSKLNVLYDMLRHSQLNPKTLAGLQRMCSSIETGDYHGALQCHSQTVASGSFAQMSAFMPHIKKLLTTCMQHQIYLN